MQETSLRARFITAGLATLSLALLLPAQVTPQPSDAIPIRPAPQPVLDQFHLSAATIQDLRLPATVAQPFRVDVILVGRRYTLDLQPYEIRAKGFKLITDDGQRLTELPPGPSTTYRGSIAGLAKTLVAASLVDGQLWADIHTTGGVFQVQPIQPYLANYAQQTHVVFPKRNVKHLPTRCEAIPGPVDVPRIPQSNAGNATFEAEIAIDCDNAFYARNGSNTTNTQNAVTRVMNGVDAIYQRDVDVQYKITAIVIRTSKVYNGTSTGTLLTEMRSRWNSLHGNITRDLAHLFTGVGAFSGVIGTAYLSVVCSSSAYGVSKAFHSNNSVNVGLVAHETGHNWAAGHCNNNPPCYIMCSGLGGCNGNLSLFGTAAKSQMIAHRDSRSCLTKNQGDRPILSSVSPSTVSAFRGGTVTLTGAKFTGATKVHIGGFAILTPGTDPTKNFTLVSDTTIRFEAPTAKLVSNPPNPVSVNVETGKGISDPKSIFYKVTSPPKLDAYADAVRGQLMLWEFGGGILDRWLLTVSASPNTFNLLGQTWLTNPIILVTGTLDSAGYGYFLVSPVPTSVSLGLKFYSQVVTINTFFNTLSGNTNVEVTTIK